MRSFDGIARNFRLMVVQVTKQVENTFRLLEDPDPRQIKSIQDGDDYVDTLKSLIENECFDFLGHQRVSDDALVDSVRAVIVITNNLERIADFTVNAARQVRRLPDTVLLRRFNYPAYFTLILEGVKLISDALFERDSARALRVCQIEDEIDRLYDGDLKQIVAGLRANRDVENLITILFALHYLERMGDALLNIGEAIIFSVLGERVKIHQYRVLESALRSSPNRAEDLTRAQLASIWGTRSGVRVGTLGGEQAPTPSEKVLFKEGNPDKLAAEQESLQRWEAIAPGLVPKVVEFQRGGEGAALLVQYLDGTTFQELLLNADLTALDEALERLGNTLQHVWQSTRRDEPAAGDFVQQLCRRLDDVYRLHPSLREHNLKLGDLAIPSYDSLLAAARRLEKAHPAACSVFIHGDLNLDNVIYNRVADTLHFVDLHRSRQYDYVQDVSVFLVSGFRLPVFVPRVRAAIEHVAHRFLTFARSFATAQGDTAFELRLALGLARSFATSTRFELNHRFARQMFQRSAFLLRSVLAHAADSGLNYRVPDEILAY